MNGEECHDLRRRIAALELKNRRTTMFLLVAIATAAILAAQSAESQPRPDAPFETIRAKRLVILDAKGTERIILAAPVPNPKIDGKEFPRRSPANGISINDAEGNERGGFGILDDGTLVMMLDHEGDEGAGLFVLPDGTCGLHVAHKDKKAVADVSVAPDGSASVLLGTPEKQQVSLAVSKDGAPSIKLRKKDGTTVFEQPK
jgi:hypothetical protein